MKGIALIALQVTLAASITPSWPPIYPYETVTDGDTEAINQLQQSSIEKQMENEGIEHKNNYCFNKCNREVKMATNDLIQVIAELECTHLENQYKEDDDLGPRAKVIKRNVDDGGMIWKQSNVANRLFHIMGRLYGKNHGAQQLFNRMGKSYGHGHGCTTQKLFNLQQSSIDKTMENEAVENDGIENNYCLNECNQEVKMATQDLLQEIAKLKCNHFRLGNQYKEEEDMGRTAKVIKRNFEDGETVQKQNNDTKKLFHQNGRLHGQNHAVQKLFNRMGKRYGKNLAAQKIFNRMGKSYGQNHAAQKLFNRMGKAYGQNQAAQKMFNQMGKAYGHAAQKLFNRMG